MLSQGLVHITFPADLYCPPKVVDHDENLDLRGLSLSLRFFTRLAPSRKGSGHGCRSGLPSESPPIQTKPQQRSPKSTTATRPRGRSASQRKIPISLNRASRYPSRSCNYPAGQITSNLRRVGVEECRPWVTGSPPSTWPVIRATQDSARAYTTITRYLPEMLEQAIKEVQCTLQCLVTEQSLLFLHNQYNQSVFAMNTSKDIVQLDDQIRDLELCIDRIEVLLSDVRSNSALQPIKDDGEPDVHSWNRKLKHINRVEGSSTFSTGPALFVEAYVYRRLRGCFAQSMLWKDYDVFFDRKRDDFVHSADRVLELSLRLSEPFNAGDCVFPWERLEKIREAFFEHLSLCIPETSNDYEILLNMTESELQGASDNFPTKLSRNLLISDGDRIWESLSRNYPNGGSRVDFVLNDAGLELFCDLALGDFMIQTGLASKVHFHGKPFPWFVSDATQKDWDWLIGSLSDKHLFHYPTSVERISLHQLGERWKGYEKEGKFVYEQHSFWSTGFNFWELPIHAPDLFSRLSTSSLVLFKGNLNYRRLMAGRHVPEDTPFGVAIGPMATHPRAPPVCSLRKFREDGTDNASEASR